MATKCVITNWLLLLTAQHHYPYILPYLVDSNNIQRVCQGIPSISKHDLRVIITNFNVILCMGTNSERTSQSMCTGDHENSNTDIYTSMDFFEKNS